jgi:hypothetical protein
MNIKTACSPSRKFSAAALPIVDYCPITYIPRPEKTASTKTSASGMFSFYIYAT